MRQSRSPAASWTRRGFAALLLGGASAGSLHAQCAKTITADVVALDQMIFYNRLGAHDPSGMMYALRSDVVPISGGTLAPGNVRLRPGKRPRPLTLRVNQGDCLAISFTNLLSHTPGSNQPGTRAASVHVVGMQLVGGIQDDGSNVGQNPTSLVEPGASAKYQLFAEKEGTFLLYSTAQTTGGDGDGGTINKGLFGAVNVEPAGAEWYRSQVTAEDMRLATARDANGQPRTTPGGQPVINYDAVYPTGHPMSGRPILKMAVNGQIQHADLTAIITGPNKGRFPAGSYPQVQVTPDRDKPFREVTVIFHDEAGIVQAFDKLYEDPQFEHTLHSGRDAFAINYGTGGIGSEVIANRMGVGPMKDCSECKLEEFFLSSWAVGDPAMVVDVPADFDGNGDGRADPGAKATKALFPDDPSNVYHSYMNDHLKIRNLHAGPKEHHIFHLHAHQWLHTPNSDQSSYLDSQAIGPGAGFTYEMTYHGSSNRNKTPGDAIFHCHFYPHFAQGMWGLWRVHDTFETGTALDAAGRPAPGARALPDGEIAAGTPIPGLVPLPDYALAPMPNAAEPGFPFFVPGIAGHRPPKPPLDTRFDGGLTRHVVRAGTATFPALNRLDFGKENITIVADSLDEGGTVLERAAMAFHARRLQPSFRVDPVTHAIVSDNFITNGLPGAPGAPFADPCVTDAGQRVGNPRLYQAASFQIDAKYNKAGWHYPQHRMFGLWMDVDSFRTGVRPPEPMFIRANTNDCIEYRLVNLVPKDYEMDDFQVKTPTDVIGQHIHLVKFDVTSSDGAANGFNYEDGSFAPGETVERVHAIRLQNRCIGKDFGDPRDHTFTCPVAKAHPFFGAGPNGSWVGAQETVQRWYVDDVRDRNGKDRTLRTVFTHDHFGPSTHQQAGLYAGLVVEPFGSTWRDPENGTVFGTRSDGGPTSWRADILTAVADSSYREFNLQLADFTLAYQSNATGLGPHPASAINPPGKFEPNPVLPDLLRPPVAGACPGGQPAPCPELVSADEPGTMSVNYRNEPLALRVRNPSTNTQATGLAGDFSHAFRSNVTRADTRLNSQPTFYRPLTGGVQAGDPFTPLLRAKEGDRIQIRVLVGAHEEGHNFSVQAPRWLSEPSDPNSGFRNSQGMGISEHYEFVLPPLPKNFVGSQADYLYRAGSATDDLWNGTWGILRSYVRGNTGLRDLPYNTGGNFTVANIGDFRGICPKTAPVRNYDVTAVSAATGITGGTLKYNTRTGAAGVGPLHDPTAIIYTHTYNLDTNGVMDPNQPVEPLVMRALPGECIEVTLRNRLPASPPDRVGYNTLPMIIDRFNTNNVSPSGHVGLHAQLVSYDVTRSDGTNVGFNPVQTAAPGDSVKYQWYAGDLTLQPNNTIVATPREFGAINLSSSDPIEHAGKGAIGALVIEPAGAFWQEGPARASTCGGVPVADAGDGVAAGRQQLPRVRPAVPGRPEPALRQRRAHPVPGRRGGRGGHGQKGFNYRTEPLWFRMGFSPTTPLSTTRTFDFRKVLTNAQVGGDPETPLFQVEVGTPVRMRVLQPGGHARNHVFQMHGHIWEELPYTSNSSRLGFNPLSEWKGAQGMHGPTNHFDVMLKNGAGGRFGVVGDYLFRDQSSFMFDGGLWGIMRVLPRGSLGSGYDPYPKPCSTCEPCTTSSTGTSTTAAPSPICPVDPCGTYSAGSTGEATIQCSPVAPTPVTEPYTEVGPAPTAGPATTPTSTTPTTTTTSTKKSTSP
jgi:hypothetical protein